MNSIATQWLCSSSNVNLPNPVYPRINQVAIELIPSLQDVSVKLFIDASLT